MARPPRNVRLRPAFKPLPELTQTLHGALQGIFRQAILGIEAVGKENALFQAIDYTQRATAIGGEHQVGVGRRSHMVIRMRAKGYCQSKWSGELRESTRK